MATKKKNQKDVMLTEHFALSEFTRSVTGELLGIDNSPNAEQIDNMKGLCEKVLEPLRIRLGHAVRITSGFRCKFLNKAVKGAENSLHMKGLAADLYVRDVGEAIKMVYLIMQGGEFDQVILERGSRGKIWVHVSWLKDNASRHQVFIN